MVVKVKVGVRVKVWQDLKGSKIVSEVRVQVEEGLIKYELKKGKSKSTGRVQVW